MDLALSLSIGAFFGDREGVPIVRREFFGVG